jgi:hypothetical protein
LAEIDTQDVGMLFLHPPMEDMLQSYYQNIKDTNILESTTTVQDSLDMTVCNGFVIPFTRQLPD